MAKANRYKTLFSNTLILGLGTFGSKIINILFVRFYTEFLSTSEFGELDLVVQIVNLLIPLISLGMNTAVLRFGMDGETDRKTVLSTGLMIDLIGFAGSLLFIPLVWRAPVVGEYTVWIYVYILCSMLHYLFAYFVKTLQMVRLFAIAGIIGTAITLLLDVLLIPSMGKAGYLLAIILADTTTAAILFFAAKLYKYISFKAICKKITSAMLRYSIPLIPTTALWWITDSSDRFMITALLGENGTAANGLYSISYKIPNLLILISGIFMDAWQMSILTEKSSLERQTFFSKIFTMYHSLIFVCGSGLIMFSKVITGVLVEESFYDSWQYMPTLVIATALSCLVTFLGTIYVVEKRSKSTLWTTIVGTVANIILNFFLISPRFANWGAQGAAIATAASYAVVFLLRAVHTRQFVPITWDIPRFSISMLLLTVQCVTMIREVPYWMPIQITLFVALTLINYKPLLRSMQQILSRKKGA